MTDQHLNTDFDDFASQDLASESDIGAFRAGIAHYINGDWAEDRWKTFRLRFGIYEQRQAGEHMMRIKQPGGRVSLDQARTIAQANAAFGGGDIHITTRQGVQLYFIALKNLAPLIESLNVGGVSTREASGNTFRAIVACPQAGFCGSELTDAAEVAGRLSRSWLRHPLTQHMPRKLKTTVSGCGHDCGLSAIDDLGFIATQRDGQNGFRVVAGGGLGAQPSVAVELFDFVTEDALPIVQEAVARIHQAHSSREDKNRARVKFLVKRFGAEEFVRLVHEQFDAIRDWQRRAWTGVRWRDGGDTSGADVRIEVPLGWLTSQQLEKLADRAETAGARELRLGRDQNIVAVGLHREHVADFISAVRNLGLDASGRAHALSDLVSCPGTYTCAIGITDSHALAESLVDAGPEFDGLDALRLRISGCHNSCGHHHIADIGLHGIAKKIGGKPAPHYQIHLGGQADRHGVLGPIIPARRAKKAVLLLMQAIQATKRADETVRGWAERLGQEQIKTILAPVLSIADGQAAALRLDVASDTLFVPPATSTGECAAGAMVAEHLSDLARVARQDVVRAVAARQRDQAVVHVHEALRLPAQRLLTIAGIAPEQPTADLIDAIRQQWSQNATLQSGLKDVVAAEQQVLAGGEPGDALAALQAWQRVADDEVERILSAVPGFIAGPGFFAGAAQ
ncbi:nitrite/sulfite reductase [Magnetovibrio sp.]|uniref:nitrite/sulfite reductase n=1 Tax=Magnetovibrio sp. TaxID=2024836 RepID=UPI002F950492